MYFIDREKIIQTLIYMETLQTELKELGHPENKIEQLAFERIISVMIESIIDVGNSMIDGFIMRDPGSYEDIVDILEDEKVISSNHAVLLKEVISLRKHLVQEFTAINHETLYATVVKSERALQLFPNDVRRYLIEELGPVSAFLPTEQEESK
ncbi:DUF86 domain-containing protein [bacterium LRH843]|nr:DUF86 domain-containing protein [bacterium LRH843]